MSVICKDYAPHPNGKPNHKIKFMVTFNRELTNWATSQRKQIGYYVTVTPVQQSSSSHGTTIETSMAFSGFNTCLLPCDRQSKKRLESAMKILAEHKEEFINKFNPDTDETA